ncbi:MAG: hypothetical protein JJ971_02020 [Balneolaceae bacterium]|nr:hypothetical protein [Balneolaceae bacterium]MBO6545148.1 hypothetical protein [Balneolaceae bacterium]MBO6646544.1 hypothetical protein [Balneolaceae bacterium]
MSYIIKSIYVVFIFLSCSESSDPITPSPEEPNVEVIDTVEATLTNYSITDSGDDIDIASNEVIYSSDYDGDKIRKFDSGNQVETIIDGHTNLGSVAYDESNDIIYATNYDSGFIIRVDGTRIDTIAVNLQGPSGLAFDSDGNLFVTENQSFTISKMTPNSDSTEYQKSIYVSKGLLDWPTAIKFDSENNLYATNMFKSEIIKITPGIQMELLATLPGRVNYINYNLGYLDLDNKYLYVAHHVDGYIYRVHKVSGEFEIIGGEKMNFVNPTGVAYSTETGRIYVTFQNGVSTNISYLKITE